jgi:hypothetical protein
LSCVEGWFDHESLLFTTPPIGAFRQAIRREMA